MHDRKLHDFFERLTNEICFIHSLWYEYEALYNESEEQIELLNSFSGPTFFILQELIWDHVILRIFAITDKARNCGDLNLSLKGLISLMETHKYSVSEINEIHENLDKELKNLIKHRNKRIAHNDYNHLKDAYAKLDKHPINYSKIRNCLKLITETRNKAALSMNKEEIYILPDDSPFNPGMLIYKIKSYNALLKTRNHLEISEMVSREYPIKNGA